MRREDLLKKFLSSQDIDQIDREILKKNFIAQETIEDLTVFHERVKNKKDYTMGLVSEAGRLRLEQKILLLRMERFQKESEICLGEIIQYAKECIREVSERDFMSLIERSYKNSEITLGKVYQNICSNGMALSVWDTSKIRFGMIEDDFIKFIRRVERRGTNLNCYQMISEFVELEKLDNISKIYIKSTIDFPSEVANYISFAYLRDFDDQEVLEGLSIIKSNFDFF